jgi:hypothetical protein
MAEELLDDLGTGLLAPTPDPRGRRFAALKQGRSIRPHDSAG